MFTWQLCLLLLSWSTMTLLFNFPWDCYIESLLAFNLLIGTQQFVMKKSTITLSSKNKNTALDFTSLWSTVPGILLIPLPRKLIFECIMNGDTEDMNIGLRPSPTHELRGLGLHSHHPLNPLTLDRPWASPCGSKINLAQPSGSS